jgi:large subunit ribosomal protein L2
MALRLNKPITAGLRGSSTLDRSHLTPNRPHKKMRTTLAKNSGRNNFGRVTTRHQGGRQKRFLRTIDWKRSKRDISAMVEAIEYDPNRTADIALICYTDGERAYILAPEGLKAGDRVAAGENAPLNIGNALPLKSIPVGTPLHCLEIVPGKGAQMGRGAGTASFVTGFEDAHALVKLPSGEIRRFNPEAFATIGQVGNSEWKNINFGKAGRRRLMGIRPTVRGTAQNPRSHPHGGGEGRSGEGMHPKTPWGKSARGTHTRNKTKHSNKLIVQRRKK